MPISPTRYSRVSLGWVTSTKSVVDADPADTGAVFSVTGPAAFLKSDVTVEGAVTATGGLFVGNAAAANEVMAISSVTRAVSLGAIAPLESSSVVTVAFSNVTRGDTLILTVDALYPVVAANRDIHWMCSSSSTAGEVHVWGVNSTLTSVTPTASTVVRLTRINHPSYL